MDFMSHVTEIIFIQSFYLSDSWESNRLGLINQYLMKRYNGCHLISTRDLRIEIRLSPNHTQGDVFTGGGRGMSSHVALGAFNHLDIPAFLDFLRTGMPWDPEIDAGCQVMLLDEHDAKYTLHEIFEGLPM